MKQITVPVLAAIAKMLSGATVRWVDCEPDSCQRVYFANHTSHLDALVLWSSLPKSIRGFDSARRRSGLLAVRAGQAVHGVRV